MYPPKLFTIENIIGLVIFLLEARLCVAPQKV